MAYEKTNWSSGDIITAEKLNHIEGGVESANSGSCALIVTGTDSGSVEVLDKTWKEIHDAYVAGQSVLYHYLNESTLSDSYYNVVAVEKNSDAYNMWVWGDSQSFQYTALTENDYPSMSY